MKITVVGTGYVGLVSGTCFSDLGNQVIGIDKDPKKLAILQRNEAPFFEPGLAERLQRNQDAGRLTFSDDLFSAIDQTDIIFIAVGTPPLPHGEADLSNVFAVAQAVFEHIKSKNTGFKVLVTKSTVPVGTGQKLMERRDALGLSDDEIAVVSNPEFLREGTAVYDFFHPDRIVVGSSSEKALDVMQELYEPLYRSKTPIVRTNIQTSELSKYASNAFLATKISFINEMANLCELTGSDVSDISKIMGMDGRIGSYFLHPGPGYGGSCFPKDTKALVHIADQVGYDLKVVKAVEAVNDLQKERVMDQLDQCFESLKGKTIALLGIAFKPNTDDVREASSLAIMDRLLDEGALVRAFDPEVKSLDGYDTKVSIVGSSYEAVEGADAVLLVTEWNAFRELDLPRLKSLMKTPIFVDLRNVYSPQKLEDAGFTAYVIGRQVFKVTQPTI